MCSGRRPFGFDGSGAHFALVDPGIGSPLDFANGDAITLEAWVQVEGYKAGENLYVIGKGRVEFVGEPNELRDSDALASSYLGAG